MQASAFAERFGETRRSLRRRRSRFGWLCVSLLAFLSAPGFTDDRPLPDTKSFLAEARKRLQPDETRQSGYVYTETRRQVSLDSSGKATRETVNVFESYPGLPGESRWERQTVKDGQKVSAEDLAKQDRERQQKVLEYARALERKPDETRASDERKRAEDRRDVERAVNDAMSLFEFKLLRREAIAGYQTIVVAFTPRKDANPKTREGKMLQHFAGQAWVSETEYEVVKVEAEALETVSFGLGLLARVHQGSRASFERRKVNGEDWLPASASYTASARVMLLKSLRVGGTSEFSDYRKFTVATEATGVRTK
jgi:hypothetical protein